MGKGLERDLAAREHQTESRVAVVHRLAGGNVSCYRIARRWHSGQRSPVANNGCRPRSRQRPRAGILRSRSKGMATTHGRQGTRSPGRQRKNRPRGGSFSGDHCLFPKDTTAAVMRLVGAIGLEPTTPTMSRWCSNQLSYAPTSKSEFCMTSRKCALYGQRKASQAPGATLSRRSRRYWPAV